MWEIAGLKSVTYSIKKVTITIVLVLYLAAVTGFLINRSHFFPAEGSRVAFMMAILVLNFKI